MFEPQNRHTQLRKDVLLGVKSQMTPSTIIGPQEKKNQEHRKVGVTRYRGRGQREREEPRKVTEVNTIQWCHIRG